MELRIDKLGPHHQSRPEIEDIIDPNPSPAGAGKTAIDEAKINYLRVMTMTLLNELGSLGDDRHEPATRRIDLKAEVLRFESELIRSALQTTRGQQRRAARLLGTNATTLNTKLKRLGIEMEDARDGFALIPPSEIDVAEDGHHLTFVEAMCRYEISLIQNALTQAGGNQSRAARLLGLPITTLNSKIRKFKIELSRYSDPATDFRLVPAYHPTSESSPARS